MTMMRSEPAICSKCGNEQFYDVVLTWNTFVDPEFPVHNICYKCGNQLEYDDININKCSPEHRSHIRLYKICERQRKIESTTEVKELCEKCGSENWHYCSTCGIKVPEEFESDKSIHVEKCWHECDDCGHKEYNNAQECCGSLYEYVRDGDDEHQYIVKDKPDIDKIMNDFYKKQNEITEKIKNELIKEGLINTDEEEKQYSDAYYSELRKKYSLNNNIIN